MKNNQSVFINACQVHSDSERRERKEEQATKCIVTNRPGPTIHRPLSTKVCIHPFTLQQCDIDLSRILITNTINLSPPIINQFGWMDVPFILIFLLGQHGCIESAR